MHTHHTRAIDVDQWVVYTHAVLCWSHTNTYLLLTDLDEFPATPPGVPLTDIFGAGGCLDGALYAQILRLQHMCGPGAKEIATALRTEHPDSTMAAELDGHGHLAAWLDTLSTKGHQQEWPKPVRDILHSVQAFQGCMVRELDTGTPERPGKPAVPFSTNPKVIVHADAGAHFHAHDGFVFPEAVEAARGHVERSCLHMVHLYNLMSDR